VAQDVSVFLGESVSAMERTVEQELQRIPTTGKFILYQTLHDKYFFFISRINAQSTSNQQFHGGAGGHAADSADFRRAVSDGHATPDQLLPRPRFHPGLGGIQRGHALARHVAQPIAEQPGIPTGFGG